MKIFAVMDIAANAFGKPFFDETTVNAIRGFDSVVNEKGTPFNRYPKDFALYELGSVDRGDGSVTATGPTRLAMASEVLRVDSPLSEVRA